MFVVEITTPVLTLKQAITLLPKTILSLLVVL